MIHHTKNGLEQICNNIVTLLDALSSVVLVIEKESGDTYRFLYANSSFLEQTGFKKSQVMGKLVNDILPSEQYKVLVFHYKQAIKKGKPYDYEVTSPLPNGPMSYKVTLIPLFDGKKCTHIIGTAQDITQHRNIQEKLATKNKQLKQRIEELERFMKLAVGRELRIAELKEKLKLAERE